MLDLTRSPRLLKLLSLYDRGKQFLLRRNRGKERADRNLVAFYGKIWREAAEEAGATIEPLGHGCFEIRLGDFCTRVQDNSSSIDDLATHTIVRTKPVMYKLLAAADLPIPRHVEFTRDDMQPAVAFLEQYKECVVKPACDAGGGRGVVTGIRTRNQLARAGWWACFFGKSALIEEQLAGRNYRLLYLNGQLVDAVVRHPPTVVADGQTTVLELVRRTNEARLKEGNSHSLVTVDFDMQRTLAKQKFTLHSTPKAGVAVVLKTATNENSALDNVTATELLCDSIIADGARAAAATGVTLAGVDVLTTDPGVPLRESGGVILEVNSPPGYYWHYHKREEPFPVAVHVLQELIKRAVSGQPVGQTFLSAAAGWKACPT